MHHPYYERLFAKKGFDPKEIQDIVAFLEKPRRHYLSDKGFSKKGEIVVAAIFCYAKERLVSFANVLSALGIKWEMGWRYQPGDVRADPDAPGEYGLRNRLLLEEVYKHLSIPNFYKDGRKIPNEPIAVKTCDSTYKFGLADSEGWRTVAKENGEPLDHNRCKINFLVEGKCMGLVLPGRDPEKPLKTTVVEAVMVANELRAA